MCSSVYYLHSNDKNTQAQTQTGVLQDDESVPRGNNHRNLEYLNPEKVLEYNLNADDINSNFVQRRNSEIIQPTTHNATTLTSVNDLSNWNRPNRLFTNNTTIQRINQYPIPNLTSNNNVNGSLEFIPSNQVKTPLSLFDYHSNISESANNSRRGSYGYPLTPQTSSSVHSYKPNIGNSNLDYYHNKTQYQQPINHVELDTYKYYYDLADGTYIKLNDASARELLIQKKVIPINLSSSSNDGQNNAIKKTGGRRESKTKRKRGDDRKETKRSKAGGNKDDDVSNDGDDHDDDKSSDSCGNNSDKNRRSRGGCLTCRRRKIRCCETKPVCSECKRTKMKCRWPVPGYERKNKSKVKPLANDEVFHEVYGRIKVLRGVVEYRIEE